MSKVYLKSIRLVIALLFLFAANSFAQGDLLQNDLNKSFKKFDLVRINTQQALVDSKSGKMLRLQTADRDHELVLQPNDMRPARFRAEDTGLNGISKLTRNEILTFKGYLKGEGDSQVRINFGDEKVEGYFVSEGTRYFIESAKNYSSNANGEDFIIYRAEDYLGKDDFDCNSEIMKRIDSGKDFVASNSVANLDGPGVLELATDADLKFVNALGGANQANEEILFILNMVEGVLDSQLNLSIQIVFQHTWSSTDPYNGANSQALAQSFKDHWQINFPTSEYPRDSAHLFSAKDNVLSQGYAYIGAVCVNPSFAYGISGLVSFNHGKFLVTSHELAHNVGGNHAEVAQSCGNTIMNSGLTGATPLEFCQFSKNEVSSFMNVSGSCLAPPVVSSSTRFDFDGDSKTDISIFRAGQNPAQWWIYRSSNGGNNAYSFGLGSDKPVPADFTGDGRTDLAFFRESTGEWFILRSEDSTFYGFPFGVNGDIPAPGDFDGDAIADVAVFRPSSSTWFINRSSDGNTDIIGFGISEDKPVVADYDGDGKDDIAIYRPSVSQWWLNRSTAGVKVYQFGISGDKTVQGDYTGDGKADVAFWRPNTGEWFVIRSNDDSFYSFPYGTNGDIPTPGDYDGDGTFDAGIFRPSTTTWFLNGSTSGTQIVGFGISNDIPLANVYSAQ